MTAALTLDAALAPYSTAAQKAGMPLPAFLLALAKETGVLQAFARLAGAEKPAPAGEQELPSIFDMPPEQVQAEVEAAMQAMRQWDEAARSGDLSNQGRSLPVTRTRPGDLTKLLRIMHEEAKASGMADMTMEEIDAEIAAVRRERRLRKERQQQACA